MNETTLALSCTPGEMDALWERGWRHFGPVFFRYSEVETDVGLRHVIPLRIDLERFAYSTGDRKTLRRNEDLSVSISPVALDEERRSLFQSHAKRFTENRPLSLENFLGRWADRDVPCRIRELSVKDASGRLMAASYFAMGMKAWSSIYAMFDPRESPRRLGIATLLWRSRPPAPRVANGCITATPTASPPTTTTRSGSRDWNGMTGRPEESPVPKNVTTASGTQGKMEKSDENGWLIQPSERFTAQNR